MKMEHCAFNVADPVGMADWYVAHLGMRVRVAGDGPVHVRFIEDSTGGSMIEVYHNPAAAVADFGAMHPLMCHLAFTSADVEADTRRLVGAGATVVDQPFTSPAGDRMAMLRDPWGLALQLVDRQAGSALSA